MYSKRPSFGFLLFCFLLFTPLVLVAENQYERKISISEWVDEMAACKDSVYDLENVEIELDPKKDTSFQSRNNKISATYINSEVVLTNCKLPETTNIWLNNIVFRRTVTIAKCKGAFFTRFNLCDFKQGMNLYDSDLQALIFDSCNFDHRVAIMNLNISALQFNSCHFDVKDQVVHSQINLDIAPRGDDYQYIFKILQIKNKISHLKIKKCRITAYNKVPVIRLELGEYGQIIIRNTDFQNTILDLSAIKIEDFFIVRDCQFNKPIGLAASTIPVDNMLFRWDQISKVGLANYFNDYEEEAYTANSDEQLSDVDQYNTLISSYHKFFSAYKTQGDRLSSNACYVAMKDIESRQLEYLYEQDQTLTSYFNWRLNQFLKYFCDYGTSPVQSLIISMWTILGFAVFYFFFYSNWDRINRIFLMKQYRKMLRYFRSEQKMEDFYSEEHKEEFQTYREFKMDLEESKIEIPFFFSALGRPLYHLSLIRHRIITGLYRRTEILSGRWIDLKPTRKIFVGSTVGLAITVYLVYLGVVRGLNSIILSINTFSTLGFGDIPVKGITRYVAILEGFLGWFLLSIFSVSLISQILQN